MKPYCQPSILERPMQLSSATPQWVSTMGLEWLHDLLLQSNDLWKRRLTRQG
jgi:UDP-N-acetyl-D-mannosaminuronic acid transferase (WecB/TagA/CpsF family)